MNVKLAAKVGVSILGLLLAALPVMACTIPRQRSFDLRQLFLDAINNVESVETVTHDHNATHCFALSVPLGHALADVEERASQVSRKRLA